MKCRKNERRVCNVVKEMTIDGNFDTQKFWKLRKVHNRKEQSCTSVIKEGVEMFTPDQIKRAYKEEFQKRMERPQMDDKISNVEERTNLMLHLLIDNHHQTSDPFTSKELDHVLKEVKGGKSCGPDGIPPEIFINGGKEFEKALLEIINKIKDTNCIPSQWNDVDITTIYKNKGVKKDLGNQRGIFLAVIIYKIFEKLLMNRINEVMKNINPLQAGGRKGRSTTDQTFILRSLVNHSIYLNRTMFLTCYDYKQCFDKLWLQEALLSFWRLGVSADVLNLIYKLNAESHISIKTPFGKTESFIAKDLAKQGTVLGPSMCCSSLGEVLDEFSGGVQLGDVAIPALAFVDDLNCMETDITAVHESHDTMVWFTKKKRQPLNKDKCCVMCINEKPGDVEPTLTVDDHKLEKVDKVVYIGDVFNKCGNNDDLIENRVSKGMRCIRSCFAECGDVTLGQYSIEVLLVMYKSIFVPTILFNSGAWCNLTTKNKDRLTALQMRYLKRVLHVPSSTPNVAVLRELGVIPIGNEVEIRQLTFLHHILSLEPDDPVRRIYEQQKRYHFEKSWYNELQNVLNKYELSIDEEKISEMSKESWKGMVKKKVYTCTIKNLNEKSKEMKKTHLFPPMTSLQCQKYMINMKPHEARLLFRVRSNMIDLRAICHYLHTDTTCRLCNQSVEDLNHVLNVCSHVSRNEIIVNSDNLYKGEYQTNKEVVKRIGDFMETVKERTEEAETKLRKKKKEKSQLVSS